MAEQQLIPVEDQDIENLQIIKKRRKVLIQEAGAIEMLRLNVKKRESKALEFDLETEKMEIALAKQLEEKYGKGHIDTDKKVFIPIEPVSTK